MYKLEEKVSRNRHGFGGRISIQQILVNVYYILVLAGDLAVGRISREETELQGLWYGDSDQIMWTNNKMLSSNIKCLNKSFKITIRECDEENKD